MKIYEALNSAIPKNQWSKIEMQGGAVYSFPLNEDNVAHTEFMPLKNPTQYFSAMKMAGLLNDSDTITEDLKGKHPDLANLSPIVNIGFGVNMSPEVQNFDDRRLAFVMLSTVVEIVLDYHESNNQSNYVFGTNNDKKISTFERMLRRHTPDITRVSNLDGSNGYNFLFVRA